MNSEVRENLIDATAPIRIAARIIDSAAVPIALVHRDGQLLGTVTDGDIRRGLLRGVGLDAPVTQVMNARPFTARPDIADDAARKMMQDRSILQLPLVDGAGRIAGLKAVTEIDRRAAAAPSPENLVVIMAGGLGRRLRPITADVPKPMIEVGGKPILATILERFVAQGFRRITLAVNYKREMIENYFGERFLDADLTYLREDRPMGTAGALGLVPDGEKLPLIVVNGDLLARINFHHLLKFHQERGAPATMGVFEYKHTVPYGVVSIADQYFDEIVEKPVHRYFVNAGIYVLAPQTLKLVPKDAPLDMPTLFERVKAGGQPPAVFPLREYWIDIGRMDDLRQAQAEFFGAFPDD